MTAAASNILTTAGFTAGNNGVLRAASCRVELNPVSAQFYELKITTGNSLVTTVVHESAIKIAREIAGTDSASLTANR